MNTITYAQILNSIEFNTLESTNKYLYFSIDKFNEFILYNSTNGFPKLFSLQEFKDITPFQFFEFIYSISGKDIVIISSLNNTIYNHEPIELGIVLAMVLKLKPIQSVNYEELYNQETFRSILDFDHIISKQQWKYSLNDNYFYLIPHQNYCTRFNSRNFEHFGNSFYRIIEGTPTTENIFFLNPYTMFEYYSKHLPSNTKSLNIGFPEKTQTDELYNIIIRSTKEELEKALFSALNYLQIPYQKTDNLQTSNITIHFLTAAFPSFFNKYGNLLNKVIKSSENEIAKEFYISENNNKINISPSLIPNTVNLYPAVTFQLNCTTIEAVLHYIINQLNPNLKFTNISHYYPEIVDTNLKPSEEDEIDIPNEILDTLNTEENDDI